MPKKKRIIWSAIISMGLLVLSYWVSNLPLSLTGEALLLKYVNAFHIREAKNEMADSILYVNVSYDREMVPLISIAKTDNGASIPIPQGRIPITDRHKLLKLLQYLKEKDDYAYILLDVFFSANEKTGFDEELYSTIASMSRVVIPYREDEMLADESLKNKAFLSKYSYSIWETGFTKYQYYRKTKNGDWEKTLPAAMYEDLTGKKIKKIGPVYWGDGHFAKRSNFLSIDVLPDKWYNLGMDLLDDTLGVFVGDEGLYDDPNLTKDKYIVIGRIDNDDMHESVRGELPGSVIVLNAFYSMKKGQFQIKWWFIMLLFAIYFSMTYFLVFGSRGKEEVINSRWYKNLKMGWRIIIFLLLSWLGYASILGMFSLLMYLCLGKVFEFFIVSNVFSAMSLIVKFNKQG